MNDAHINRALRIAALLVTVGSAGVASAHTVSGSLGTAAGATDLYYVTCSNDGNGNTARLDTRVRDNAPIAAPIVGVTVIKSTKASHAADAKDGDAVYSPLARTAGVNGVFYVAVSKSQSGAESYTLDFHCVTSTGVHTGTASVLKQNQ